MLHNLPDIKRKTINANLLSQYRMTYDLYVAAFAGAGITLLALVSDCASAGANLAALTQWGATMVLWLM